MFKIDFLARNVNFNWNKIWSVITRINKSHSQIKINEEMIICDMYKLQPLPDLRFLLFMAFELLDQSSLKIQVWHILGEMHIHWNFWTFLKCYKIVSSHIYGFGMSNKMVSDTEQKQTNIFNGMYFLSFPLAALLFCLTGIRADRLHLET